MGPDEPRYASIGREMANSGDWVTPRLNGSPWFEKPPLIYWMTGVANRLGLRDEWAARLPVALMSLAFLAFFFETLRREFSGRVAITATAILGSSAGWLAASFAAVPDLPMSAALGAAMFVSLFGAQPQRGWLAGAFLGLAVLAKGFVPLALFVPVLLVNRGRRLATITVAFLVAAPWYLLCLARNGSAFWNEFFWKHHIERALSADAIQHGQPFWYYLPVLLTGLFPWTPLAALMTRGKTYEDARVRFLSIWFLAALVFFSLVPNKLPLYVLPLMPSLAIVLATAVDKAPRREWWIGASVFLLVLLPSIGNGLPEAILVGATKTHWSFSPIGLSFVAVTAVVWWLARRGQLPEAMLLGAVAVVLGGGLLKIRTLPLLEQRDSVRTFYRSHQTQLADACIDSSVSRSWAYGIEYYAGRGLPECGRSPRAKWQIRAKDGALLIDPGS